MLGPDQRDAGLLYRVYRFARLRNVGDRWPAGSAFRAVERQALVSVMAERAGVRCPRVDRVVKDVDGTAMLVMERINGHSPARLRSAYASLARVAPSPVKLALLFGGSALVTLAYIGGLAAAVQAFGGGVGIAQLGAVYLGAAAIAAASPTPGGLGAIEAALVAGLTGIGLASGPAVSAVLVYRLATYWLPVVPGWACLRLLQRGSYV